MLKGTRRRQAAIVHADTGEVLHLFAAESAASVPTEVIAAEMSIVAAQRRVALDRQLVAEIEVSIVEQYTLNPPPDKAMPHQGGMLCITVEVTENIDLVRDGVVFGRVAVLGIKNGLKGGLHKVRLGVRMPADVRIAKVPGK